MWRWVLYFFLAVGALALIEELIRYYLQKYLKTEAEDEEIKVKAAE